MSLEPAPREAAEARAAWAAAVGCYLIWGFLPLFLQAVYATGAGPWEILAHRIVWSVPVAAVFVAMARQGPELVRVLTERRTVALLAVSALLIAGNWATFIVAVNSGRVVETSLGYYITPLINMAAGALLFRETLSGAGKVAVGLAVVGVVVQALALGHLPYISLILGLTFAGYGVARKWVSASAQTGLLVECLVLTPAALAFLVWLQLSGGGVFTASAPAALWLIAAGPMTATPLALFAWSARRLPFSALGFLQFVGPTTSFAIGIAQGEPFTPLRALSFAFIWGGAAVFVWGAWRAARRVSPS